MNLQAIMADVDEMLGWVPLWFVGLSLIAVAILLALLLYRVAVWLLNRAFGTRLPLLAVFVERTAGPARRAGQREKRAAILGPALRDEGEAHRLHPRRDAGSPAARARNPEPVGRRRR